MTNIRKPLNDRLITDLSQLTYASGSNPLFANVVKIFATIPANTPVCEVSPFSGDVIVEGNDFDRRVLGWQIYVYEKIGSDNDQNTTNNKIDRLNYIEDAILDYLEAIPNNLEHVITDVHVLNINVTTVQWDLVEFTDGIVKTLTINFTTEINIDVKNL